MPVHIYIRTDNREYGLLHTLQIQWWLKRNGQ